MTQLVPMPDGDTLKSKIAAQKHEENQGYFVVGLKGDLERLSEDEAAMVNEANFTDDSDGSRIVLRTIQAETIKRETNEPDDESPSRRPSMIEIEPPDPITTNFQRLRVLLYVHRPFIYCFLFENRTSSLQYPKFYRDLHQNLKAIQKPLLSSTDKAKVAERVESSINMASEAGSTNSANTKQTSSTIANSAPIFELIYDPRSLTMHTSIPNIPEPGTPAAEGILTGIVSDANRRPPWTRIEALNVHSQILNTLSSVKARPKEIERTSKTNRGWWVVWMKMAPSATATQEEADSGDQGGMSAPNAASVQSNSGDSVERHGSEAQPNMHRTAFVVRKAPESSSTTSISTSSSRAMSGMFGNMSFGFGSREDETAGGASASWGPAALTSGIGVDARKYVEGLLSLNR